MTASKNIRINFSPLVFGVARRFSALNQISNDYTSSFAAVELLIRSPAADAVEPPFFIIKLNRKQSQTLKAA
jgi:hypothetical protein